MVKKKTENSNKGKKEILEEDNRPSFCTIVRSKQSNESLAIPSTFLKLISNELSNKATLKVRSGCSWTAKVTETSNGVFIEDGWQEFIKDNSLVNDEFLRVSYEGNMCFSIQIFEITGCERMNVPLPRTDQQSPHTSRKRPRDSRPNVPCIRKHQNSASTTFKRPRGRPRKIPVPSMNHHLSNSCENGSGKSPQGCKSNKPNDSKAGKGEPRKIEEDDDHLSKDDIVGDQKAAECFRSKYPHFKQYVGGKYQLNIPAYFAKEHLRFNNRSVEVVLRNQKGGSWEVNLVETPGGRRSLCSGWVNFVEENKLERNDLCIFELVGRKVMKVHIFRMGSGR